MTSPGLSPSQIPYRHQCSAENFCLFGTHYIDQAASKRTTENLELAWGAVEVELVDVPQLSWVVLSAERLPCIPAHSPPSDSSSMEELVFGPQTAALLGFSDPDMQH
ncbi:hypothetical protein MHYP_G00055010 [Metynnis hypsauchen]